MKKQTRHWLTPQILVIAMLCMTASFGMGVRTTGEVQTVDEMHAETTQRLTGDMNGDMIVDTKDVIEILEIVRGYKVATTEQLRIDPTGDGIITIDDAIKLLRTIRTNAL